MSTDRELRTNDQPETRQCTDGGVAHDYRPHHGTWLNRPHTYWRCVWCHGVTCGNYGDADPCWEIYHHPGDHIARSGLRWPLGEIRPDVVLEDAL